MARGGIEVSMEWDFDEKNLNINLEAQTSQEVTIKFPEIPESIEAPESKIKESEYGEKYREIELPEDNIQLEVNFK